MAQFAQGLISAYQAGTQERQADEKRSAIKSYLPGALSGDRGQAQQLAGVDPDIGMKVTSYLDSLDANTRQRELQDSEWLAPQLVGPDGKIQSDPSLYKNLQMLAAARGMKPDKVAAITPENAQLLVQGAEAGRQYMRQGQQDARQSRMDAETMRHNRVAEASAASRIGTASVQLPTKGQTYENEGLEKIQIANNNTSDVTGIIGQIDSGQLDPGLLANKYSEAKSFFGAVDPNDQNTRNYNTFVTTMERLRNESLRLNKGVQTDSDAKRAWAELFKNINDKTVVRDQLDRIAGLNKRAAIQHAGLVRNNRKNYMRDKYIEPEWETLGIDPSLVTAQQAPHTSFVRGGAGVFDQSLTGQPSAPGGKSVFDAADAILNRGR